MDHDKFWELSWFEWSLYARRHKIKVREFELVIDDNWRRFRIQWADFINANTSSKGKKVKPQDLIKLPEDDLINASEVKTPDMEAMKRRFGTKIKSKNGK
jgi:hypothetical protein